MSLTKWIKNGKSYPNSALAGWAEDFFKDDDGFFNRQWNNRELLPAVNVQETKETFNLDVAVPGMTKKDFKLEIENGILCISAETKTETEDKTDKYTRKEFDFHSFKRSFWLPENVDIDAIKAIYKEGILKISIPKTEVEKRSRLK